MNMGREVLKFSGKTEELTRRYLYPNVDFGLKYKTKLTNEQILRVLMLMLTGHYSAESGTCFLGNIADGIPSADSIQYRLTKLKISDTQKIFNAVMEDIWRYLRRRREFRMPVYAAIDLHDKPYYGNENDFWVVPVANRRGTKNGFKWITLEIVVKGKRLTLAELPCNPLSDEVEHIKKLIAFAKRFVEIKCILLDKGFFGIDKINAMDGNFLMAAPKNKRIKRLIATQELPYVDQKFVMENPNPRKPDASVKLIIVEYIRDDSEKEQHAFCTNINASKETLIALVSTYHMRWGIETGYRVKEALNPKTCTKDFRMRHFYFVLSICLYNLWVLVNIIFSLVNFGKLCENPLITVDFIRFELFFRLVVDMIFDKLEELIGDGTLEIIFHSRGFLLCIISYNQFLI